MRKLFLSTVICILAFPLSAAAQSEIRVIHDDGSVDVIDIGRKDPPPEPVGEPEKAQEPAPSAPSPAAVPKPVAKAVSAPPPKAKRKPKPSPKIVTPPRMPVQRSVQPGVEISREKAIAIAIDYAPPSADVEVFRTDYDGTPAVAVVFKGEEGFHEVLLNAFTGTVLDSRESQAFSTRAAPGHLPKDLR